MTGTGIANTTVEASADLHRLRRNVQFRCIAATASSKSNREPSPELPKAIEYLGTISKFGLTTIPVNLLDECHGDAISAPASQNRRLIGMATALSVRWKGWGIGPHLTFLFWLERLFCVGRDAPFLCAECYCMSNQLRPSNCRNCQ